MNKEIEELLFKTFPEWFNRKDRYSSSMRYGFTCGDGWGLLIKNLFEDIKDTLNRFNIPQNQFEIVQVKEKLAELRVYYKWKVSDINSNSQIRSADKIIHKLINEATEHSRKICEKCGKKGKLREVNYYCIALCDKHYKEKINNEK